MERISLHAYPPQAGLSICGTPHVNIAARGILNETLRRDSWW